MSSITQIIESGVIQAVAKLYEATVSEKQVNLSPTRKDVEGDFTLVVFPFTKIARKKPDLIAEEIGTYLVEHIDSVGSFSVIKGFLNLTISDNYWKQIVSDILANPDYGKGEPTGKKVMVEFSSPNTNKPLHLGHIRNILLGWSSAKILEAAGNEVVKVQIVNDRGIAICKSMLAWQKFGEGATPESTGIKSDHFVGDYYVLFEQKFKAEYAAWQQSKEGQIIYEMKAKKDQDQQAFFKAYKNTYFNEHSTLGAEAKAMLLKWEAGEENVIALWQKMNNWVYAGFETTYQDLGVSFDKLYYESDTYLLGKSVVEKGLENGHFYQKEDGSVWIDLTDAKLDHKIVLRSDGTAVYMTQDIGTAMVRYEDFGVDKMIYVVADEQNYHFQVLFEILKRLEEPYADGLHHLSYGMVDLPTGKMKSREGTVVDADDLMAEVIQEARNNANERGEIEDLTKEEQEDIIRKVALAALKYFIIKVNPKKRMVFDPKESVDMQGQTGPYIQYSYVRINGLSKRAATEKVDLSLATDYKELQPLEKDMIIQLYQFPQLIQQAAQEYDPSLIANYCYGLAKSYSKFWHDHKVFNAETKATEAFRVQLSKSVGQCLKAGLDLLGMEVPQRM